jgi:chromosome segregation ATPase
VTAAQAAAEAEAAVLRQQLQEAQQQQAARGAEMAALRAALAESQGTIHALEAELQDTMEAAMQLWDTVQVRARCHGLCCICVS